MCRGLVLPMLCCLVLGTAVHVSAELVAYWPLEEDIDGTTPDASGNGRDGTLVNGPAFVPGMIGQAIELDGSSTMYVDCGADPAFDITDALTVGAWIRMDHTTDRQPIVNKEGDGIRGVGYRVETGGNVHVQLYKTGGAVKTDLNSATTLGADEWYHLAYTYEFVGDGSSITRLYINGEEDISTDATVGPLAVNTNILEIGRYVWSGSYQRFFSGLIDDVQVYSHVLSQAEIVKSMQGLGSPEMASAPNPEDGATDVLRDVTVAWTPGEFAQTHDVYLGIAFDDVNDASRANPMDVLVSEGQGADSYDVGRLEFGQTYYWRIDEVNGAPDNTIYKGAVWSFTAEPFAYAIENVAATSNGSSDPGAGPENTVNGSGLNADDEHSMAATDMWLATPGADPLWIQYEFDRVYKLHEALIWNYNVQFELVLGFGVKDVTIEYSTDGTEWTVLGDVVLAQATATASYAANTAADLAGVAAKFVRLTVNSGYGPMGQFGLSEVRFMYTPTFSQQPQPADGADDVAPETGLSWRPGREAAVHEIYLGTEPGALALFDTSAEPTVLPESLELGTTYYWRVDEVNEAEMPASWEGDIWEFSTPEYLGIDDMESYDDEENRIYDTWLDGFVNDTGSTVGHLEAPFAEQAIIHGGAQSMPLFYDNTSAAASEADLTLADSQDWTRAGIQILTLYFRGDAGNDAAQLYVKINDSKVIYDEPDALALPFWRQWNIDLGSVSTNLDRVNTFTVGVEGSGAKGIVYVDDIRLYRDAPAPAVAQDPGTENLLAHYAMENNATDSSGNGNNGTPVGSPVYAPGIAGMALDFDGIDDRIDLGTLDIIGGGITLSMWLSPDTYIFNDTRMISKATGTGGNDHWWMVSTNGADHVLRFRLKTDDGQDTTTLIAGSGGVLESEWTHAAATWDGSMMRLYQNLEVVGSTAKAGTAVAVDSTVSAAIGNQPLLAGDKHWDGLIDEMRIYSRGLTASELLHVASGR